MAPAPAQVPVTIQTEPPEPPPPSLARAFWPFEETVPFTVSVPETVSLIAPPPEPPCWPPTLVSSPPPEPRSAGAVGEPYVLPPAAAEGVPAPPPPPYPAPPAWAPSVPWPVPSEESKPRALAVTNSPDWTVKVVAAMSIAATLEVVLSPWVMVPPVSTVTVVTAMVEVFDWTKVPPLWTVRVEPEKRALEEAWVKVPPEPTVRFVRPPLKVPLVLNVPLVRLISPESPNVPLFVRVSAPVAIAPFKFRVPPEFTVRVGTVLPPAVKVPPEARVRME